MLNRHNKNRTMETELENFTREYLDQKTTILY